MPSQQAQPKAKAPAKKPRKPKKPNYKEVETILLDMKKNILDELRAMAKASGKDVETLTGDIYDQASTERDRELTLLLSERERMKLKSIAGALERMEDGEFGECEMCSDMIPLGRLKVMPFARLCVDCQEETEVNDARIRASAGDGISAFGTPDADGAESDN